MPVCMPVWESVQIMEALFSRHFLNELFWVLAESNQPMQISAAAQRLLSSCVRSTVTNAEEK